MSSIFIVFSSGGAWSNDDVAEPGIAGAYSTKGQAEDALRNMMIGELADAMACGDEDDDIGRDAIEKLSFDKLEEKWSEFLDTEPFVIIERVLDAALLDVHNAGDF